jgi:uncharacterized protein (TIGR00369 family)
LDKSELKSQGFPVVQHAVSARKTRSVSQAPSELQKRLDGVHEGIHAACVVCGARNPRGLRVPFRVLADGSVEASFPCPKDLEGYPQLLHGGVIASLLDGAMTNCLFAQGITAVTAELTIRYHTPVAVDHPATIRASLDCSAHGYHLLTAELRQDGRVAATAQAKFLSNHRKSNGVAGQDLPQCGPRRIHTGTRK